MRRATCSAGRLSVPVFALPAEAGIAHEAATWLVARGMARSVGSVADVVAELLD